MIYTDLNPANGMGANCCLVEIGPFKLVVDCGINPKEWGRKAIPGLERLENQDIDAAVITHCHLDHLGALPLLPKHAPEAEIFMSVPSEMLYQRMLRNSVQVMKRQREEHYIPEYPLYLHEDVDRLEKRVHPLSFGESRFLHKQGETLEIILHAAGHVAGAAGVELVYKHRRIFFTGDVLFEPQSILPGARFPKGPVDTLVMETTRGANEVDPYYNRNEEVGKLFQTVSNTLSGGGSVLIPVFALGRMQEILNLLHRARLRGQVPVSPVFSSGLGMELADYIDKITKRTELCTFSTRVIREMRVKPVKNLKPGKRVAIPGLYVCSSGMMVPHTPSWRVAASMLPYHENTICFAGYCDPDTPGGKLLATRPGSGFLFEEIEKEFPLKARVRKFDLSGHANREELMSFAGQLSPRSIVLTHGDPEARDWFAGQLSRTLACPEVHIPTPFESCLI